MATYVYGNNVKAGSHNFYFRSFIAYTASQTNTTYSLTLYAGVGITPTGDVGWNDLTVALSGTNQTTVSVKKNYRSGSADSSGRQTYVTSRTWTWSKGTSAQNKTITAKLTGNISTSTATYTFTVPALTKHVVSYNANGGSGSIASQNKYYGQNITLSNGTGFTRNHYTFKGWNTAADGSGTHYEPGAVYSVNSTTNRTLYAEWELNAIVVKCKVNGAWQEGIINSKDNNAWSIPYAGYVKVNGEWKEIQS